MEKTIYQLELHESIFLEPTENGSLTERTLVTRVPGGWMYNTYFQINRTTGNINYTTSIFVPYNEEFKL